MDLILEGDRVINTGSLGGFSIKGIHPGVRFLGDFHN